MPTTEKELREAIHHFRSNKLGLGDKFITRKPKSILKSLKDEHIHYQENTYKKYLMLWLGITLGLILGYKVPFYYNKLANPSYIRGGLDEKMSEILGETHIKDVLSDEVLIVAYDYNNQAPRFFSKYFSNYEPNIYDKAVGNATAASASAPTYFDPRSNVDAYGFTEL